MAKGGMRSRTLDPPSSRAYDLHFNPSIGYVALALPCAVIPSRCVLT